VSAPCCYSAAGVGALTRALKYTVSLACAVFERETIVNRRVVFLCAVLQLNISAEKFGDGIMSAIGESPSLKISVYCTTDALC
jgi:hypothetical protein